MSLNAAEKELLSLTRGGQSVCFALVIQCDISEWMVTLESREPDPVHVLRGVGRSFEEAWHSLQPLKQLRRFSKPACNPGQSGA